MVTVKQIILLLCLSSAFACETNMSQNRPLPKPTPTPDSAIVADSFAYPIGTTEYSTQAKDKNDDWYNALEFGERDHLGEDWNLNSGGNTDCGEPVYAIADGKIRYAKDAGIGWGNVVIITHTLPDGKKIQSLSGHMQEILRTEGEVKKREQIGKIGGANGRYPCHLHFEIREETSPMWDAAGPGYSQNKTGWVDPSDFIDSINKLQQK